jgi:hypothetical protein
MDATSSAHYYSPHSEGPLAFFAIKSFQMIEKQRLVTSDNIEKESGVIVDVRRGERWRCQNPDCRSEIFVTPSSRVRVGATLRCSCGEIMKKPYARPELETYFSAKEPQRVFKASLS